MQTPNINFCLAASTATTLIPNSGDSPPPAEAGSETNPPLYLVARLLTSTGLAPTNSRARTCQDAETAKP